MSERSTPPTLTVADLLAAARRHGLDLTSTQDELDGTGLDFLVAHAVDAHGTPWIVRSPRRPDVYESSAAEARTLKVVRTHLPVAVPDWQVHAPDIIAYPRLPDIPAVTMSAEGPQWNNLDPAAPSDTFIRSFAAALASLQSIPPTDGIPVRENAEVRASLAKTMDATREALQPSEAVWARWHRWLADDEMWPQHIALVHGDLHPGHMLLADDGRITGILDWTEACFTDPSIDLAMFLGCFGRPALERLLPPFIAAGGRTWPRLVDHAAERWAAFPPLAAEWALRTDNPAILEHARAYLAPVTAETT